MLLPSAGQWKDCSTFKMRSTASLSKFLDSYALGVRLVESFAKIFFVEPHGGGDAARRPVDHHIGQQVVQGELPASTGLFSFCGDNSNENKAF